MTDPIQVHDSNWQLFEKRFARLVKTAGKLGVEPPSYEVVGRGSKPARDRRPGESEAQVPQIRFREIVVSGSAPVVPGFEFLGRVEPSSVKGVNFVHVVPGVEEDLSSFRTVDLRCDHCQTTRQRKSIFLIRDTDSGHIAVVGKTCLKDFTGHKDPEAVARYTSVLLDFGDSEDWGSSERYVPFYAIEEVLSLTAAVIEEFGWHTASAQTPTRGTVFDAIELAGSFNPKSNNPLQVPEVTDAHRASAAAALAWGRSLSTDHVVNQNDYLLNLRLAVEAQEISRKEAGLVCSIFGSHARALGEERKQAERAEATDIPTFEGRVEIEGEVVSAKWRETDFGETLKIVVRHADGWRVWGSCPRSLGHDDIALVGQRVRFCAAVEVSSDDAQFGFFRRPTKAERVEQEVA